MSVGGNLEPLAWGLPPWALLAQRWGLGFPQTPVSRVPRAPALRGLLSARLGLLRPVCTSVFCVFAGVLML